MSEDWLGKLKSIQYTIHSIGKIECLTRQEKIKQDAAIHCLHFIQSGIILKKIVTKVEDSSKH